MDINIKMKNIFILLFLGLSSLYIKFIVFLSLYTIALSFDSSVFVLMNDIKYNNPPLI